MIMVAEDIMLVYCLRQESMFSLWACVHVCVRACVRVHPSEFVDSKTLGTVGTTPALCGTDEPMTLILHIGLL